MVVITLTFTEDPVSPQRGTDKMPTVDENSNMTDANVDDPDDDRPDLKVYKKCSCCPFGYHIDLDFVPFSEKMLAREENGHRMQKLKDLKEKWRSERQSMDKLLGFQAGPWHIKISPEARHDRCEFTTSDSSMTFHFPNRPILIIGENQNLNSGEGLDDAVVEFEDVLARAKRQDNKPSYPFSNDQNFHTYPRLLKPGRDGDARSKVKIHLKTITGGANSSNKDDRGEMLAADKTDGTANVSPSTVGEGPSHHFRESARIQALEEQIQLIPQLIATVANLTLENQNYLDLLNEEKKRRRKMEDKMKDRNPTGEIEKSINRKRMQDASVGPTVTTRDAGVLCVEDIASRFFGGMGRIDYTSLERDSSSPTGSLNGRRRARTFEIGIQVNEYELVEKDPPPPLLIIVEKHDIGSQTDLDKMLAPKQGLTTLVNEERIPKVMRSIGCNIKPKTIDFGILVKPFNRDESSNTSRTSTRDKGIGTMPFAYSRASGDATKPQSVVELKSIGMNTVGRQVEDAGVNTSVALSATAAQTETVGNHDFGMQTPPTTPSLLHSEHFAISAGVTQPTTESMEIQAVRGGRGRFTDNSFENEINVTGGERRTRSAPEKRSAPKPIVLPPPKPLLLRSNTYTKDIPLEEEVSDEEPVREGHLESTPDSKYLPSTSFDLSIPTIVERRESVKPSKEMQGALKVLNDALLRGKTTEHVTSAIGIILHEWFRVSGSKSACAHDVEDYLDLYESYSPELLKYVVNMPDGNGNTAMHYAVSHGNFDVVSVLLDSNCCDINRANKAGYTCIMLLSLANMSYETDRHVVGRLCSMGDVNIKATQHGQTALMLAASQGQLQTCHALLTAGADVNIKDDDGSTALMCAAEHGHIQLVNYFVANPDCDLHITDNDGSTALNVAMEANHKDVGVTLYAHMHLMDNPKNPRRRLSYPTYTSSLHSSGSSPFPVTRSAGNSPGTIKKLHYGIPPEADEEADAEVPSSSQ